MSTRDATIRNIVPNLRRRWPYELGTYSDDTIACLYEAFARSSDHGDNDARFPLWFGDLVELELLPSPREFCEEG